MLAALPALAFIVSVLACYRGTCWRQAILEGAVAWGAALVAITEALSPFHMLVTPAVAAAWAVVIAGGLAIIWRRGALSWWSGSVLRSSFQGDRASVVFYASLGATLLILGVLTITTAPNTWDSMTYHLARVVHWQQSGTLAPYPTHILRQLYLQPAAEYAVLHLRLLGGSDQFAGVVQFGSMLGALVGVSLIAERLGAGRSGVLCGVAATASIPIGILESTSTQNDYVVTFWLVCFLFFCLRIVGLRDRVIPWWLVVATGASLGLAVMTKATAYLVAFPFVVWIIVVIGRRGRMRGLLRLSVAGFVALALNGSFYARNESVFGSPLGPFDEGAPSLRYLNDALTPGLIASNVVRDVGLNFVATPIAAINVRALHLVTAIHSVMGVDIQDARTTWGGELFREQNTTMAFDEDFAGNPMQVVLGVCALIALWPLRHRLGGLAPIYACALVAGFIFFAAFLRWQPWHTRLELAFLVLCAPLVGLIAEAAAPRLALVVSALLLVSMLPWLVNNRARPLIGPDSVVGMSRQHEYFTFQPELETAYAGAVGYVDQHGCTEVGYISNQDGWEYPLVALSLRPLRIEHVGVTNVSGRLDSLPFAPCAVMAIGASASGQMLQIGGRGYAPAWSDGQIEVLLPESQSGRGATSADTLTS